MTFELSKAKGVYAIATTPFKENYEIDFNSVDKLADYYLDSGVTGVTILGVMGEAPKLNLEEQKSLINHYIKRLRDKVPVIVGVSNPGLDNLEALSKLSMDYGAKGVMVAGLSGLKNDDQIFNYIDTVVNRLDQIPICLQDYPPTTNVYFSISLINKILKHFYKLKCLSMKTVLDTRNFHSCLYSRYV